VKKTFVCACAVLGFATAAHSGELADTKVESELREQNRLLTKRIVELEKGQHRLEAQRVRQPAAVARSANPTDAMAADYPVYKVDTRKKPPVDDSLTWNGITLYGLVDMGVTYQTHGAPLSATAGLGLNYLIAKNSNGSYFGVAPNALSSSFVGLKGNHEILDGLSVVFNLQTGFNPQSGRLSDGLGSVVQNNGLAVSAQNSFADSAKDGQAFNVTPMPV
jgi:hypothetical protein